MIRTKPPSNDYRDGWDRVFGDGVDEARADVDEIRVKIRTHLWHCKTCSALVSDPENHQYHAVIRLTAPEKPRPMDPRRTGHHAGCAKFTTVLGGDCDCPPERWPTSHESDCPARIGDPCRCPVGNL